MERLTRDNPKSNIEALMNYAYARDKEVYLRYAGGVNDVSLAEYIAKLAVERCSSDYTKEDVLVGDACQECDCVVAVLNAVATQAAELRSRLKCYEDLEEQGRLVVLPCKVGASVWFITPQQEICPAEVTNIELNVYTNPQMWMTVRYTSEVIGQHDRKSRVDLMLGKIVFLTREEAEAALRGGAAE